MHLSKPKFLSLLLFYLGFASFSYSSEENKRPVIGILSTPSDMPHIYDPKEFSYIKGSYAEFVEAANGVPIAIPWDLPEVELIGVLASINGVLFTGGDASLWEDNVDKNDKVFSNFTLRAIFILQYVLERNVKGEHYPLYGICQGHEVIGMGIAGTMHVIDNFKHPAQLNIVNILGSAKENRMFGYSPDHVASFIREKRTMFYNHQYGFNASIFAELKVLREFFDVTAKGVDDNGKEFIAAMEAKHFPIYTVQYHPERVLSEWNNKTLSHQHSDEAIESIVLQASLLVNEAKKNFNKFTCEEHFRRFSLRNHEGVYLNVTWPKVYFYDKKSPIRYHVNSDLEGMVM